MATHSGQQLLSGRLPGDERAPDMFTQSTLEMFNVIFRPKIDITHQYVYSFDMSSTTFDSNHPFNELPPLPPAQVVETVPVLKTMSFSALPGMLTQSRPRQLKKLCAITPPCMRAWNRSVNGHYLPRPRK
ncbi:hypothetical protein ACQX0F_09985 [Corynebacterium diphtheriae]